MSNGQPKISTINRLSGNILHWLSQIVYKTCRLQITNLDTLLSSFSMDRPVIYTSWHGLTMMAIPAIQKYHPNLKDFVVLMPDDHRGAALLVWAEKMGATPHKMKLDGDNTMGMARQVVRLTRRVVAGRSLYINPDGPDGPSQVIKPGIEFIAKKANAVIFPLGAYCRWSYSVPRWDRYTVPLPFSRIAIHFGEPIEILPEDNKVATELITINLNRVALQAAADYYELRE